MTSRDSVAHTRLLTDVYWWIFAAAECNPEKKPTNSQVNKNEKHILTSLCPYLSVVLIPLPNLWPASELGGGGVVSCLADSNGCVSGSSHLLNITLTMHRFLISSSDLLDKLIALYPPASKALVLGLGGIGSLAPPGDDFRLVVNSNGGGGVGGRPVGARLAARCSLQPSLLKQDGLCVYSRCNRCPPS